MKSIYRLIIANFILVSVLIGSDSLKTENNKSIQFSISDNIFLTDKGKMTISLKNQIKENRGIRLGFGLSGSTNDKETDNSRTGARKYNIYDYHISLFLQYILSLPINDKIKPFIGSGPYIGYGYSYNEETYKFANGGFIGKIEGPIKNIGLLSNIGIEIFTFKNICFDIEYNFLINYKYCKTTDIDMTRNTSDGDYTIQNKEVVVDKIYIIEPLSTLIGISVYF